MITDPPPISFTTLSEKKKWHVTCDTWHVTCDMWPVTHDMWHVTRDTFGGVSILSKFQLPSSYRLWFMILWRSGGKGWLNELMNEWINQLINDEAVYRTDPATPGLLKMSDTNSCIWKIPNLLTNADRSTDTERNLLGDVWTDIRKYGHTKRGGSEKSCSRAKSLHEALDVLHRKKICS